MKIKTGYFILLTTLATVATAEPQPGIKNITWTGFYAGVSLGAIFNESRLNANGDPTLINDPPYATTMRATDVLPGIQAGYNYQLPSGLVIGSELEFTYPDSRSEFTSQGTEGSTFDKFTFKNKMQGAIQGRLGYALNNFLPYVTGGVSFADTSLRYDNDGGDVYKKNSVQVGWSLGGGLEYALCKNLSLRTEYQYTDYGRSISMEMPVIFGQPNTDGFAKADLISHSVRAALNFHF